jgi:hypothetical protein
MNAATVTATTLYGALAGANTITGSTGTFSAVPTASANVLTVINTTTTGNVAQFSTSAGTTMVITGAGNVGIGTPNPAVALDVYTGTINAATVTTSTNAMFNSVPVGQGAASGGGCLVVGLNALGVNVVSGNNGSNNTAVGNNALGSNTGSGGGGYNNTAVGSYALNANTTGLRNTAVGRTACNSLSIGINVTAVGHNALYNATTGSNNTALGQGAGSGITTGGNNTALGVGAGYSCTTGNNNAFLGWNSGSDGLISISVQSNYVVIGNNSTAVVYCKQPLTNPSDARDKTNIVPISVGLEYVTKLKPVSFNFDDRGWYPEGQSPDGTKMCSVNCIGFLAQDILATENEIGLPFNHVINTDFPEKLAIAPGNLIPILVKSIQELTTRLQMAEQEIALLKAR